MVRSKFYRISSLRGRSLDDCFAAVERSPYEDFKDIEMNTWVLVHLFNGSILPLVSGVGNVSSLWVSPKGTVYLIAYHEGKHGLHIGQPTSAGYKWQWQVVTRHEHTYVSDVWGLSEEMVFAWGGGVLNPESYPDPTTRPLMDDPYCWLKQEETWTVYTTPGWIYALHGQDHTTITAVGNKGLAARWQTDHWETLPSTPIDLGFVQVTQSHEIYGASYYGKLFTYQPSSGWKQLGTDLGFITGLVSWKNETFLLLSQGLFRLEGDHPVSVHPSGDPRNLVAGDSLLWSDDQYLYEWNESRTHHMACSDLFASTEEFSPSN